MRFASFGFRLNLLALLRWLAIFCLLCNVSAHPLYAQQTVNIAPSAPAACEDGAQSSGATYRICMPAQWNNKLIVYAHGYVAPNQPVGIPEGQMKLPGTTTSVDQLVTSLGYAFATSGYSRNGLAVLEAVDDLVDVVKLFKAQKGVPTQVLLVGISEGGLITTLAVEQHAEVFNGGLAMCGPYGSFREQTNYFGDFRVLFDVFFPNLVPPTPVDVPADLLNTWESSIYSTTVKPVVTNPDNVSKLQQLLTTANAAYDSNNVTTQEQTVSSVLWYNIFATNDAKAKLGGQPFDNQQRTYSGSDNDTQLNQGVQRFSADQAALDAINTSYETTGKLTVPLVTMHTTGDPVVPASQAHLYRIKTILADNLALHENITVTRYGHCQFNQFEILNAFNTLTTLVDNPPAYKPAQHLYLPVVY
jgi:pimeloyl-ACP methyl ester carboxylesterase